MRRALPVLLLLSGCFNPDDIFPVHGSITSVDSVSGQQVQLLRDAVIDGRSTCADATAFKDTTTDDAGNYSFDIFRAEAQKLTGSGRFCFRMETTFPSNTFAFTDLRITAQTTLPAFPDWRAQPSRADGVLHFVPAAPLPDVESLEGDQLTHRAQWFTGDGGLAWQVDDRFVSWDGGPQRSAMALDDATLEDFTGAVQFSAELTSVEAATTPLTGATSTAVVVRSGETLSLTGTRLPVSRGLPCPALGTPCPLTDGDLTEVDAGGAPSLTLTLAAPVRLSAVVLRGLETSSPLIGVVLLGADGGIVLPLQHLVPISTWGLFTGGGGGFANPIRPRRDGGMGTVQAISQLTWSSLSVDAGVPIGGVMVVAPGGITRISEVSLFE